MAARSGKIPFLRRTGSRISSRYPRIALCSYLWTPHTSRLFWHPNLALQPRNLVQTLTNLLHVVLARLTETRRSCGSLKFPFQLAAFVLG